MKIDAKIKFIRGWPEIHLDAGDTITVPVDLNYVDPEEESIKAYINYELESSCSCGRALILGKSYEITNQDELFEFIIENVRQFLGVSAFDRMFSSAN